MLSAGFDAHKLDPTKGAQMSYSDYRFYTEVFRGLAQRHASDRLISVMEGGYNPDCLKKCVQTHVLALMADGTQ